MFPKSETASLLPVRGPARRPQKYEIGNREFLPGDDREKRRRLSRGGRRNT